MKFTEQIAIEDETGEEVDMGIRTRSISTLQKIRLSKLVWKHLATGFVFLALLYISYMFMTVYTATDRSPHLIQEDNWIYMAARDEYLEVSTAEPQ